MSKAPFIVWSPEGPTPPVVPFETHKHACAVAHLMARKYRGQTFMVMQRAGSVIVESDEPSTLPAAPSAPPLAEGITNDCTGAAVGGSDA